MENLYANLGLTAEATAEQIRRAYRQLALKTHPDKTGGDAAEFRKVQEAHEVLSDPERRQAYDVSYMQQEAAVHNDAAHSDVDGFYYQDGYRYTATYGEYVRRQQDYAEEHGSWGTWSGWFANHGESSGSRARREYQESHARERAAEMEKQAREQAAEREKEEQEKAARKRRLWKEKMQAEEEARIKAIANENRLHDRQKPKKQSKQAASRKNCSCQGCQDRYMREQAEKDEAKNDPEGYAQRLRFRAARTAQQKAWAEEQVRRDAEREEKDKLAAEQAEVRKKLKKEKEAAEEAARELAAQEIAREEAKKAEELKIAAEEAAERRRQKRRDRKEARRETRRQGQEAEQAAKQAAEMEAQEAAQRAAAEEAHRLAEEELEKHLASQYDVRKDPIEDPGPHIVVKLPPRQPSESSAEPPQTRAHPQPTSLQVPAGLPEARQW